MNILLDTHVLIWVINDSPKLTKQRRNQINNAEQVFVSLVSLWECVIKVNVGKLKIDLHKMMGLLERFGFELLPLRMNHIEALVDLPLQHRDPFDRMLIAQAKSEPLILVTDDKQIHGYF